MLDEQRPQETGGEAPLEEVRRQEMAEAAAEAAEAAPAQECPPDPMQEALAAAQSKADEYLALCQRVQADFDNFRKRNQSVRADAFAEGKRDVAERFLIILDNLERALSTAEPGPLRDGVELTLRLMRDTYEKLGVAEINRPGQPFDPNLENAVMQAPADAGEPGTVAQVLQKGYQMDGHVLRHAMVSVVEG